MKKQVFLLAIIGLSCLACQAQYGTQFENRGFETWANFGSGSDTYEPVHWHSGMSADGSYTNYLSKQIEPSTEVRPGSTGNKSARLWPKTISFIIFSVTANGNLTNGRMYADDMTAAGPGNYNYTIRAQEPFNTPINTVPDSLSVWVCFRSNGNQNAQVQAVVHGDADFKCLANGSTDPSDKLVATAKRSFPPTTTAGGNYVWRRLSIPFVHNGPCNDPRYILLNITTNETPGQGNSSDDLLIDDVLLIYRPSIQLMPLSANTYQIGENLTLNFTLDGTMSPDNLNLDANQVIVQLSDPNGSFSNPMELGRITTNLSGSMDVTIPSNIVEGDHYRIRLVTTNYPMISEDNGTDLSIVGHVSELVECFDEEVLMELYDLSGRCVNNMELTPGVYIAKYQTNKGGIIVKKILKQ